MVKSFFMSRWFIFSLSQHYKCTLRQKKLTQLKLVENLKTKETINHDFCIQKNSTYINNMK